ncbi:MAG: YebC/PmpR family DNA-binding transcriptional regulator [Firmicutes bacterium]|jgi:YebC/PmpR family DNA-binding regulatory protein|nr:YebC/PmpR family DNA-binding transcriptional regulator [Bacillota bacterium]MEE3382820.1 YebC/PmpR family DNA-binding transcriptional regulator [Anaerovoracaceae bacterium]MBQ1431381.1 YebC/PmpR family DNA-binding transcriptional regulator [Bacillota bacterium]MBQ1630293.1 YebC/PmpR family DNA-binding transcriptional regulator [Bacillota bacterium]MBQ1715353.1 YebC/PmpR family DNA-binding transcriptional regulator [Bacillota bacterium]
MGRHGTIAGRKAAQDSKRAAMFTKYAKAITVAAKDGGDPDYNASLRLAIEKAKAISMPNDNIQRAIKKGTGELGNVNFEEMSFEGYGLGGVAVIVDALTDNTNRTTSSVRSIFDKYGGNLGTPGCVSYMFSSKGVLVVDNEEGNLDEDTVMEDALEAGADDMVTEEGSFVIYTDPSAFADVLSQMKEKGYEFVEADIEKVPSMEATPKPEDLKRLSRMINLLEENEDVQKVHHNCAVELVEE